MGWGGWGAGGGARRGWVFECGHFPAEYNLVADALSRVTDPKGVPWPAVELGAAVFVQPPKVAGIWLAAPV